MSGILRATSAEITTINSTNVNADAVVSQTVDAQTVDAKPIASGTIIEYLSRPCNGGNLTGRMGLFPIQDVTDIQQITTTYQTLLGSSIDYQPPPETRLVIYRFHYFQREWDTNNITHFRLYIDNAEVVNARHTRRLDYSQDRYVFEWPFVIGESDNADNGMLMTWGNAKNIRLDVREYSSSYEAAFHKTNHWDGGGGDVFSGPTITLIAIA